jgi:hypothetical protein
VAAESSLATAKAGYLAGKGFTGTAERLHSLKSPRQNSTEAALLNRFDHSMPPNGEAEVKYLDGDFRVVRPGSFVRCAVTGAPIALEELKYWSVDRQEAYISPEAVLQRHKEQLGR